MFLAIDIGSRHTHLIEGEYKKDQLHIRKRVTILTPEGTMGDGEILNKTDLILKLRNAIQQNGIKAKKAIVTVNPASVINRNFIIPEVKSKEIVPVLTHHVATVLGLNEPYIVDYCNIEKQENHTLDVEVIGLSASTIQSYMEIVQGISMKPYALDLHQNNVARYFQTCIGVETQNSIVADIGNSFINIYYFKGNQLAFTRRSMINTEEYETTLVSLGCIKGINGDFRQLDLSPQGLMEDMIVENTMRVYLSNIAEQIQRVIEFKGTQGPDSRVSTVYICGGMANMKGIEEYLDSQLDVKIKHLSALQTSQDMMQEEIGDYINAIGALLRKDEVNFFKRYRENSWRENRMTEKLIVKGGVAGCVLLTIVGGMGYYTLKASQFKQEIHRIDTFLSSSEVTSQLEIVKQKSQLLENIRSYTEAIQSAAYRIESHPKFDKALLQDIENKASQELKITSLTFNAGTVDMLCVAKKHTDFADFVYKLRQSPEIYDVNYSGYQRNETDMSPEGLDGVVAVGGYTAQVQIILAPGGKQQ